MKESGNAAYKCKNFDEALNWYTKAAQLDPTDMTFLTNKAGTYQDCLGNEVTIAG